ncbi:hypothetical protein VTK73DRAFT_2957 [Phialemonium thermophilum]|uniref:50S ribosomal protein L34, chloroplastic n=1 Tax=Phialemonium thermophilum TaxID=223376 RepID=A0ABR3X191_9PEZI
MERFRLLPSQLRTSYRHVPQRTAVRCAAWVPSFSNSRMFSSLPSLRPTLPTNRLSAGPLAFRPTTCTPNHVSRLQPSATEGAEVGGEVLDLISRAALTGHPAFAGAGVQIRCGPRATLVRTSRLVQKRRHGFLSRARTKKGRQLLTRRRIKGRKRLSA